MSTGSLFVKLKRRVLSGKAGRRRLRDGLGVEQFFRELERAHCRYVVLRWFDTLPQVAPGEDLDILVADEDAAYLQSLLTRRGKGSGTPCDVYSVSGLPGTAFRSLPYYPPAIAEGILSRAVVHVSGARVPSPEDYFLSLAFHAIYHKGLTSGLEPAAGVAPSTLDPEHDYKCELQRLAHAAGISTGLDMAALDAELARRGWRPPPDMLVKLGARNPWCEARAEEIMSSWETCKGLAAFVIREVAGGEPSANEVRKLIEGDGFHVLRSKQLTGDLKRHFAEQVRGGTWAQGPWPSSAGGPAWVLIAVDIFPITPSEKLRSLHPAVDNERVFRTKESVRKWWNRNLPQERHTNIMHSSDEARHAAHYLKLAFPDEDHKILGEAREYCALLETHSDTVLRDLSGGGRRARVQLVRRSNGQLAVRKTFRPYLQRFLQREADALDALRGIDQHGVVPPLLERSESSFLIPYYDDVLRAQSKQPQTIPLWAVRKAFAALRVFHQHGYEFLDFGPHNLVIDREQGLKLIDFEFVFKLPPADQVPFAQSQSINGPSVTWQGDKPVASAGDWYRRRWFPYTGLPLRALLDDGESVQVLKRAWHLSLLRTNAKCRQMARRVRNLVR